ncbi:hypothetical protein J6500_17830 [Bradyrhizobium sp. WSM 1704]|nr:hypothetical protein [Bradyrhizobium semiaridum]
MGQAAALDPRWLKRLIGAMEQAALSEVRQVPCDARLISAVSAHLARPAASFAHYGSAYRLRN